MPKMLHNKKVLSYGTYECFGSSSHFTIFKKLTLFLRLKTKLCKEKLKFMSRIFCGANVANEKNIIEFQPSSDRFAVCMIQFIKSFPKSYCLRYRACSLVIYRVKSKK